MSSRATRRPNLASRLVQVLVVMATSAGLAYGGSAALATRVAHFRVRPLADVFAVLRHAHRADAASAPPPREPVGGASATAFAATFPTGDSVYVATLASGDICVVDQEPQGRTARRPPTRRASPRSPVHTRPRRSRPVRAS